MQGYEIPNFGMGYVDTINEEVSDPSSTQNCLNVTYSEEGGAISKDVGIRVLGEGSISHPLYGSIQRLYEGTINVSDSAVEFAQKKLIIADGIPYTQCYAGYFTPITDKVFSSIEIPDITHIKSKFFITGGHGYDIREYDGMHLSISTNYGLSYSASLNLDISGSLSVFHVSTKPMYRAKTIEVFSKSENRVFIGNVAESDDGGDTWSVNENRIVYSQQGNVNVWSTLDPAYDTAFNPPGVIDVDDKSGDEILRLYAYRDVLLIFKRNSIHSLIYTGGTFPEYERSCIDRSSVGNCPWTIAEIPDGLIWLSLRGLQITDGQTVGQYDAGLMITNIMKRINQGAIDKACATTNEKRNEYLLALPLDGSSYNNYVLIWNWKNRTWRIKNIAATAIATWTDNLSGKFSSIADYYGIELNAIKWNNYLLYPDARYVVYGNNDGYINRDSLCYNLGSYNVAYYGSGIYGVSLYSGTDVPFIGYDSYHETPWLDFGVPGVQKELIRLNILWKGAADTELTIKCKSDSNSSWRNVNCKVDQGGVTKQDNLCIRLIGRKFKFRFENNNANQSYVIYKLTALYHRRDWR